MKLLLIPFFLTATIPTSLTAQGSAPPYAFETIKSSSSAIHFRHPKPVSAGLLGDGSRDHRYTGMYAGLGLGALLVVLNLAACDNSDMGCDSGKTISRAPVALVLLGGVGALIGRAFPKHHSSVQAATNIPNY
jgi:hypothetical protein